MVTVVEPAVSSNPSTYALVEARYDHYEDIFRYWWPWFSDLATVVAIKLKIWIVLVAMYVFGDGYYWSKWNGSSVFDKGQYGQHPASFGWGRRRKRRDVWMGEEAKDMNMAELIFDQLDINDDTCRRRIVCELYLEGKRVPEVWRVMNDVGYEVFRAYRPKTTVSSSAECAMCSAKSDTAKDFNATSLAIDGRGHHGFNEYAGCKFKCSICIGADVRISHRFEQYQSSMSSRTGNKMTVRFILMISLLFAFCSITNARTHHHHLKPLKYSYGIYAPTGWTVALYIWYIVKLGFILGALLLLLFSKKWNTQRQSIIVESGPEYFHHRSLDSSEHHLFLQRGRRDVSLYWNDRLDAMGRVLRR
uniref:Uncharacterized protein n=1 Tax=Anopheles minimus TaxID=112268 RepID=A0A182WLB6_9DIPT